MGTDNKTPKVLEVLNAIVDHVTRLGTEADDALRAQVFELSDGKVGSVAKGTVSDDEKDGNA